jgi:ubiquinone/menaquinone biosynthesis C-methylase UbiE
MAYEVGYQEVKARRYRDLVACDYDFVGLSSEAQQRLNRFKLGALLEGHFVEWEGRDVLEFGAGHGRFAVEFKGYRSYLGIESSAPLVKIGEERLSRLGLQGRARLMAGDCLEFSGPEGAFDLVCSLGMFQHFERPEGVVRKMALHAKPGGVVLADFKHATPIYTPLRKLSYAVRQPPAGKGKHAISTRAMREAMLNAGLTDITFVMREYPLLGNWYAVRGWDWALAAREALARRPWLNWVGFLGFVAARKPL